MSKKSHSHLWTGVPLALTAAAFWAQIGGSVCSPKALREPPGSRFAAKRFAVACRNSFRLALKKFHFYPHEGRRDQIPLGPKPGIRHGLCIVMRYIADPPSLWDEPNQIGLFNHDSQ